jgi:hypothetical protein
VWRLPQADKRSNRLRNVGVAFDIGIVADFLTGTRSRVSSFPSASHESEHVRTLTENKESN